MEKEDSETMYFADLTNKDFKGTMAKISKMNKKVL